MQTSRKSPSLACRVAFIAVVIFSAGAIVRNVTLAQSVDRGGNRLAYLDEPCDPFYPCGRLSRLETPQWIGEEGVDAVIVLSIDDLGDPSRYEAFLRPVFERLKAIDGRAPVSIMTVKVDPTHPVLQKWLAEGVSLEVHTFTHPCPLLQGGDFAAAKKSYEDGVDHVASIPGVRPQAVRIPCCDSMSSPSPRFFAEIFPGRTPAGHFLWMDSSVFVVLTRDDPALPPEITVDELGRDRFAKYIPQERELGTYIENYPYPYVIGKLCWEIPAVMPSDWNGQRLNGKCHPQTLRDWQYAVDAVVTKKGIWALCFHPHGWIAAEQIVALIDYTVDRYGKRVKFLTFAEVLSRLEHNLLGGQRLRGPEGGDGGVRILDVNGDGWMDVIVANEKRRVTRIWNPELCQWSEFDFPVSLAQTTGENTGPCAGVHFGILGPGQRTVMMIRDGKRLCLWQWTDAGWKLVPHGLPAAEELHQLAKEATAADLGIRFRDVDGDGSCEFLVGHPKLSAIYTWRSAKGEDVSAVDQPGHSSALTGHWEKWPFALPGPTVDERGRDAGLRLIDLDGDGDLDALSSTPERWFVAKFGGVTLGWQIARQGDRQSPGALPPFIDAHGSHMGVWFKFGRLWIQNEYTDRWVGEGPGRFRLAAQWIELSKLDHSGQDEDPVIR